MVPYEDDPAGGIGEVSFTKPCEGAENGLLDLSTGLRSLDIKDPAVQHHIHIGSHQLLPEGSAGSTVPAAFKHIPRWNASPNQTQHDWYYRGMCTP